MSEKELVLVAGSGGFDSTINLALIQLAGYKNIIAVHFNYGTISQLAEELAIKNITKELNIPLRIFNLESIYTEIDVKNISMLTNRNIPTITGTKIGLKSTAAWHPCRNLLMQNVMFTLAEAEIMKHNYNTVYFVAGWQSMSEASTYPDNSKYFSDACFGAAKYGSLVGNRFKILYSLCNIMKFEQYVLMKEFNLQNVYCLTISCDRATVETPSCDHTIINHIPKDSAGSVPCNCMKNGIPACGSGLLAWWSSKMIGLDDMKLRNYYELPSNEKYEAYVPKHLLQNIKRIPDINTIIDRILLPPDKLNNLRKQLNENKKLISQ